MNQVFIILYAPDYSPELIKRFPFAQYFAERGLCHVSSLQHAADKIVLITAHRIPTDIVRYNANDVFGFSPSELERLEDSLVILAPEDVDPDASPDALFDQLSHDGVMIDRIDEIVSGSQHVTLINFAPSRRFDALMQRLDAEVAEPCVQLVETYGSKFGSKHVFTEAGVPCPIGDLKVYHDASDMAKSLQSFFSEHPDVENVILKLNEARWAGAAGNLVVGRSSFTGNVSEYEAAMPGFITGPDFVREVPSAGAIFEAFSDEVVASPSSLARVDDAEVVVLSIQEQIVLNGHFSGFRLPIDSELESKIHSYTLRVGDFLSHHGFRGSFGIDFIQLANEEILAVEINIRKTAATHVLFYVAAAFGCDVIRSPREIWPTLKKVAVVHRRFRDPDLLGDIRPRDLIENLSKLDILFDQTKKSGIILHGLGALEASGYLETTAVAKDLATACALDERFQAEIKAPDLRLAALHRNV